MSGNYTTSLKHEIVRASAGAGKTFQLTTRYLDLLRRGEAPEHILATTFTRKAAGEVLARVLGRLADACQIDEARQQLGLVLGGSALNRSDCLMMLRSLADRLNRLAVGTIDGFFNRAAQALALELGLPLGARLIDEQHPLAKQLRTDAIHAVLGEQAAQDGGMTTLIEMLRRLHHDTAQRSVAQAIDDIVSKLDDVYRACSEPELWDQLPTTGLLPTALLTTALHGLEAMHDQAPRNGKGQVYKGFVTAYEKLLNAAYTDQWDRVLANGLVEKVLEQAPKYGHAPIDEAWHRAIKPIGVHAKAKRLEALADQTRATHTLMQLFDPLYEQMRWNQRVLLFSDLTHLLAKGLPDMGEDAIQELCYRLDSRVTHLLLDEFQDTSLQQWAVLEPFAEEVAADSGGERSLFVVGDTKQAIYGWRGGCAELFDAVEAIPGVQRRSLSMSWRSSPIVLDAVNQVFAHLANNPALADCERAARDWQAGFETHAAEKDQLPGHVVLRTTAPKTLGSNTNHAADDEDTDDPSAPPDPHARYVARYIQRLTTDHPGQSIGVLVRSKKSARTLMHELRNQAVHAAEEGGNPIDNVPAVGAVLAAVQLADHPGDRVARFHVTNSPMGDALGIDRAAPDASLDRIARDTRRVLIDKGYASVIAGWVEQLAPSCDAKSLGRLMQLVEIAERYDQEDAGLRPGFFGDAARAVKVDDPSPARVRVMTIHAAKGLEFDAVVLPELDAMLSRQDQRSMVVLHRDSPIAPINAVFRRTRQGEAGLLPELEEAHEQQAYEKRTEDLCLLYVAMTRARQALHLLVRPLSQRMRKDKDGNATPTGKPTDSGWSNLSYAAMLRQALRGMPDDGFDGDELLFESGQADWSGASDEAPKEATRQPLKPSTYQPVQLAASVTGRGRSWVQTTPSAMHNAGNVSARDLLRLSPSGGRDFGTLMHKLFEQVGFMNEPLPNDALLLESLGGQAVGIDPSAVMVAFKRALDTPAVRELLSRAGADELWRERPFMVRHHNRLIRGNFDRVHLWHQDGQPTRALLIDFKTDHIDDASLDEAVARYTDQLDLYRVALSAMTGLESDAITTQLCFVGAGRVVGID